MGGARKYWLVTTRSKDVSFGLGLPRRFVVVILSALTDVAWCFPGNNTHNFTAPSSIRHRSVYGGDTRFVRKCIDEMANGMHCRRVDHKVGALYEPVEIHFEVHWRS
jgi:hypothetical protein